jgi:hypothetical protein
MTQLCCPSCRLRFTRAAAALLTACPDCGLVLEPVPAARAALGYRLFVGGDRAPSPPLAVQVAIPPPMVLPPSQRP